MFLKLIPTVLAFLCALALLPWLLGVPGVENDYARGWTIGLYALLLYLLAYIIALALMAFAHFDWLPLRREWLDYFLYAAVAGLVLGQVVAWSFILR